jgi:hypothetical protein
LILKEKDIYSSEKEFVVYEMRREVLPTPPSPTTTHFIACIRDD